MLWEEVNITTCVAIKSRVSSNILHATKLYQINGSRKWRNYTSTHKKCIYRPKNNYLKSYPTCQCEYKSTTFNLSKVVA